MSLVYNVSHNTEGISFEEFLINKVYLDKGYIYPVNAIRIESKKYKDFFNELDKLYIIAIKDFSNNNDFFKVLEAKEFIITITGDKKYIYISSLSINIDISEVLYHIIKKYETISTEVEIFTTQYSLVNNSLKDKFISTKHDELKNLSKLYYPYIDTDSMFEQFFGNQESILILCGKPGVGKSKLSALMLKYAIENITTLPYIETRDDDIDYVHVAYVKSTEILAMDEFWLNLAEKEYDLIILDDLDFFLTARNNEVQSQEEIDKNKFLNQLLSFTDGIQNNKTRFVISSNQPFSDIDKALLRKGRLFDILDLRELTKKEALNIWLSEGLEKEQFIEQKFSNTVLPSDLGSIISKIKNTKVKIKSYLKEPNISRLNIQEKKLGF